jgi:hypothetical protein
MNIDNFGAHEGQRCSPYLKRSERNRGIKKLFKNIGVYFGVEVEAR